MYFCNIIVIQLPYNNIVSISGLQGIDGELGPLGIEGMEGPPGPKGIKGKPGSQGLGKKGEEGEPGFMGQEGAKGEIGDQGFVGFMGMPGDRGEQGERGPKGTIKIQMSKCMKISLPPKISTYKRKRTKCLLYSYASIKLANICDMNNRIFYEIVIFSMLEGQFSYALTIAFTICL